MNTIEIALPFELPFAGVPHGVSIVRSENNYIEFAASGRNWPVYVVSAVSSVGLSVLANYLYDTIKHATHEEPKTIMIEEENVIFDRGQIQEVLRRKITLTE